MEINELILKLFEFKKIHGAILKVVNGATMQDISLVYLEESEDKPYIILE